MASDRTKLVLDEQSFQGLLAAAFTIQQHIARNAAAGTPAADAETAAAGKEAVVTPTNESQAHADDAKAPSICSRCGASLSATETACPKCGASGLRPGERLQRNWASLWQMSQEQGLPLDARRHHENDFPLSPGDPGRPRPAPATAGNATPPAPAPALHSQIGPPSAEPAAEASTTAPELPAPGAEHGTIRYLEASDEPPHAAPESSEPIPERMASAEREELMPSWNQAPTEDYRTESEPDWREPETVPEGGGGRLQAMRLKLRFHRADFFLALAVIVAGAAMLWPVAGQRHDRPLWERMLIAAGLAEAPPPAVHFHGDPDLKVWVDTHTALYYCPGDELYGKSPNGHYTTQREAQADRFEPAERSVCIQ
jgi:ribosomal protein L40E